MKHELYEQETLNNHTYNQIILKGQLGLDELIFILVLWNRVYYIFDLSDHWSDVYCYNLYKMHIKFSYYYIMYILSGSYDYQPKRLTVRSVSTDVDKGWYIGGILPITDMPIFICHN